MIKKKKKKEEMTQAAVLCHWVVTKWLLGVRFLRWIFPRSIITPWGAADSSELRERQIPEEMLLGFLPLCRALQDALKGGTCKPPRALGCPRLSPGWGRTVAPCGEG